MVTMKSRIAGHYFCSVGAKKSLWRHDKSSLMEVSQLLNMLWELNIIYIYFIDVCSDYI